MGICCNVLKYKEKLLVNKIFVIEEETAHRDGGSSVTGDILEEIWPPYLKNLRIFHFSLISPHINNILY